MTLRLGEDLWRALSGETTPKFLASVDGKGQPNCVPVISIMPYDDDPLVFGEFLMNKSRKNLLGNDKVGVTVLTDAGKAWSLQGRFLGFETGGDAIERVNNLPMLRYNAYTSARAAGLIRVERVSPPFSVSKARTVVGYAWANLLGPVLRARANGARKMPRPVEDKFRRLAAVRAIAYVDGAGCPCAFPMIACISAGPNRLLLAGSAPKSCMAGLIGGTEIAVSIITPEPIAYQVKGVYRGTRLGAGIVELTACYSASPPLVGDRLDR